MSVIEEKPAAPPPLPSHAVIFAITGDEKLTPSDAAFAFARKELDSNRSREEDDAAQIVELNLIRKMADDIEKDFKVKKLAMPNVFILYSAGVDSPPDLVMEFAYGVGSLEQLPKADIAGHLGIAGAIKLDEEHTAMVFNGRAHPFSGGGKRFAEMLYARQLNIIKELMRRQRERGIQSAVITTYLTGVDEDSPLGKGDLGVVIDHTELAGGRAALSAGGGPRNYLDRFIGERFQSKLGRSSDPTLTQRLVELAAARGIRTGPAAALGTPGTTSYQGVMDQAIGKTPFVQAQEKLDAMASEIFGRPEKTSLFFDMSLSFEIDTIRQTILRKHSDGVQEHSEEDFPSLFVVVPTDIVGAESLTVDHAAVVREAKIQGERNGSLIRELATSIASTLDRTHPMEETPEWVLPDFSLKALLT